MLCYLVPVHPHHLHRHNFKTHFLKPGYDLPHQPSLHPIRLNQHHRPLHKIHTILYYNCSNPFSFSPRATSTGPTVAKLSFWLKKISCATLRIISASITITLSITSSCVKTSFRPSKICLAYHSIWFIGFSAENNSGPLIFSFAAANCFSVSFVALTLCISVTIPETAFSSLFIFSPA